MFGQAGKNPVVGIGAVVLVLVAGYFGLCRSSRRPALSGADGQVVIVCLKEGAKHLASAPALGQPAPKCPQCGGECAVARVFECHRGHLFIGFLERPPAGDASSEDVYARHLPLLLRPGLDKEWTPGGAGKSPQCPACKMGIKRSVTDVSALKLDAIHMGALTTAGESAK